MRIPTWLYGTAWKEAATEACVRAALSAGFRGIDTANQRKHYNEAGVGAAIAGFPRDELFLQTKFTFQAGQDHRLPYDPKASITEQVQQSFASSLAHLGTDRLDSLVLHGPSQAGGLGAADREAWRAIEALHAAGSVAHIGISNVTAKQLVDLLALAAAPPTFVQNRCYAERGWDRTVRDVCREHGIIYQGFSLLTANRYVLAQDGVRAIAKRHGATPAQVVFRFAQQVGMLPLTGTKDPQHMREDLDSERFTLTDDELAVVERAG